MMHCRWTKFLTVAAAIVAGSFVAGCGGLSGSPTSPSAATPSESAGASPSGAGQPSPSPTASAGATIDCSLAPASLVSAALGITVTSVATTDNSPVTLCTYSGGALVRFQTGEDAGTFATGKAGFGSHGESVSAVSGLGDAAYSSTTGTINTLVALQGSVEILVTSHASLGNERILIQELFAKI